MASILGAKTDKAILFTAMGIGLILMIGWLFYSANKLKHSTDIFNNTEIKGQIIYINDIKGLVTLQLKNQPLVYTIIPYSTVNGQFSDVAIKGDSIYKKRFGDTILVYHDKEVYPFLFSKKISDFVLR